MPREKRLTVHASSCQGGGASLGLTLVVRIPRAERRGELKRSWSKEGHGGGVTGSSTRGFERALRCLGVASIGLRTVELIPCLPSSRIDDVAI